MSDSLQTHSPQTPPDKKAELTFPASDNGEHKVSISVVSELNGVRQYEHKSSESQFNARVNDKVYQESEELPKVRSGNVAFDALFALALWEMKLNSVSSITDPQYNWGKPIACEGFKTGKEWDFIWTRDLSYAAKLSLALLDPQRVKRSLIYKTSGLRTHVENSLVDREDAKALEIVQDTGSGGSWPISTDRVCWAFAAESLLDNLEGPEKKEFEHFAFHVLHNTVEADRKGCYLNHCGLYGGEQSFLDWREQSYPLWIPQHLEYMATSCSLSTNVCHYKALMLAALLAEVCEEVALAEKYQVWADLLKDRINDLFWDDQRHSYVSVLYGENYHTAIPKFDWLGLSLVIITDIASPERAKLILDNYPHSPVGPPVLFPMQPDVPIYHNRAIWPFVTGFGLLAGKKAQHNGVVNAAVESLIRGAAVCVSNMENMEWLTGKPFIQDKGTKDLSGPVINSEYQLWSVAAYLEMVIGTIFGVQIADDKFTIEPVITKVIKRNWFNKQEQICLESLRWKHKTISIEVRFDPQRHDADIYHIEKLLLNGETVSNPIAYEALNTDNRITLQLIVADSETSTVSQIAIEETHDPTRIFAPMEPEIRIEDLGDNQAKITICDEPDDKLSYQLYRNGEMLHDNVQQHTFIDGFPEGTNPCYFVTATYLNSQNVSQPSKAIFVSPGRKISLEELHYTSNKKAVRIAEELVLRGWGAPEDSFEAMVKIAMNGTYSLQMLYRNTVNEIDTGITCGVKWLTLRDQDSQIVAQQIIQMPHTCQDIQAPSLSTLVTTRLRAGIYYLSITDFMNMSYLSVNADYNGISGAGGVAGPLNEVDIYGIQIQQLNNVF